MSNALDFYHWYVGVFEISKDDPTPAISLKRVKCNEDFQRLRRIQFRSHFHNNVEVSLTSFSLMSTCAAFKI